MFLKCLDILGFKSFADKTHLDFTEGITSLLGPNGCGKSNIVDSIKWVLGEQSAKALRATRMEDVIFNGTEKRKPLQFAEVSLTINNDNNELDIEKGEVMITRRVTRSGESSYFINRQLCLRKDIKSLFMDTGVGKRTYSILEQGKIDQILLQSPEERRGLFEEASGISRFKADSDEAERKLLKTDENIAQVDVILRETKRTYDVRRLQAEKARKARELRDSQFSMEVDVQLSSVKSYLMLRDDYRSKLQAAVEEIAENKSRNENFTAEIEEAQKAMRTHGNTRIQIQMDLQRLSTEQKGRSERLDYLTERFRELCRAKDDFAEKAKNYREKVEREQEELDEKREMLQEVGERIDTIRIDIERNGESLKKTLAMIERQEREISESEKESVAFDDRLLSLQESLGHLTDVIVVELDRNLKSSGYRAEDREKARRAFIDRLEALRKGARERSEMYRRLSGTTMEVGDLLDAQEKTVRDYEELQRLFDVYVSHEPTFLDDLVAPEGIISEKRRTDEEIAALRRKIGNTKERIAYLREEHRKLTASVESFRQAINDQNLAKTNYEGQKNTLEGVITQLNRNLTDQQYQYGDALSASKNAEERMYDTQDDIRATEEAFNECREKIAALNGNLNEEVETIDNLQEKIRKMNEEHASMIARTQDLVTKKSTLEDRIEQMGPQIQKLYTDFFETYGKNLKEFEGRLNEEIEDYPVLKNKLDSVKKELSQLGSINQMAEDEFNEVKGQYDFLTKQLSDLEKAKSDLTAVVDDIKSRSSELFLTTYRKISENFQEIFRRLFGGGKAELSLTDRENVLTSGIEIFAQPPGKKMVSLSLLSGGERSMTAVALLFATYKVKPSPFCILDEIDAALDDRNIGNFLTMLQGFSQTSQFIIITHNKHTVLGSSSMLGVTQVEPGVTVTVSYKIVKEEGKPVIMDDSDRKVDFDETGVRKEEKGVS